MVKPCTLGSDVLYFERQQYIRNKHQNSRARESLDEQLVVAQTLLHDLLDLVKRLHVHHGVFRSEEDGAWYALDRLDVGVDEEGWG